MVRCWIRLINKKIGLNDELFNCWFVSFYNLLGGVDLKNDM